MTRLKVGDPVIYRKPKNSSSPGPRAKQVYPLEKGETYHYVVDKFWMVSDVRNDGSLELVTRTGKKRRIDRDDPKLHKPHILEQVIYRRRFPDPDAVVRNARREA
ncbi:MAG: hypothetical protein J7D60_00350 [Prosthecochloris sp.]|nr:hypothetical protein [Prosthecochloris sp.]